MNQYGPGVRRRRGAPWFTDGPFAETKEQVAGYGLIEAPDLEAAKEIAATPPPGRRVTAEASPASRR